MIAPLPKPMAARYRKSWNSEDTEPIAVIAISDDEKWDCIAVDGKGALIYVEWSMVEVVDGDIREVLWKAQWADGS